MIARERRGGMDDDVRNEEDSVRSEEPDKGGSRSRHRGQPVRAEVEARNILAVDLLLGGASQKEIAVRLGVSEKTVSRLFQDPDVKREVGAHLNAASVEAWSR